MALLTDKQWKDMLKKPELNGVSDTGIGEQLRAWEKVKDQDDLAAKEKVLAALLKVVQKNMKDYANNMAAKRAFTTVDHGISDEFSRINEARVNTPHNAPRKTLPTIIKDNKLRAAFKDYLHKTDKGGLAKYVDLFAFCLVKPKGNDAINVFVAYRDYDHGFALHGIENPSHLDDSKWGEILGRAEERLSSVHEPFMKSPEYAKACGA
jgi:hypothetical protein